VAETFLGEEEHVLIGDETPAHAHNVDAAGTVGAAGAQAGSNSAIKQATTLATTSFGGGLAHNNMQPTWFLYTIQKL
jgi:microcystin-dependent protein